MQTRTTLVLAKAASSLSRRLGRGGGHALPGLVAERFDPHLIGRLAQSLQHGVVLVTGTNGKTTTTKQIVAMLEAAGERVLTNSTGSNMKRGVVSAFVQAARLNGTMPYSMAVFEVDEASLRHVCAELDPKAIVVLNLFRDQLDRYGELDTTAAMIGEGIAKTSAELILNADDPLVASLAAYARGEAKVTYFGVEGLSAAATSRTATAVDSDHCPVCHTALVFDRVFYGHIGHYVCPKGDFRRPQPHVAITRLDEAGLGGSRFEVSVEGRRFDVSYPLPGTYNLYNALAAAAAGLRLGVAAPAVAQVLAASEAAFGRVEKVPYAGRTVCLLLIKNPAGFTQVLETFLLARPGAHILFVINDRPADGRDVSWLWDVPLELLTQEKPVVGVSGIRAMDMALRLKYAGMTAWPASNYEQAIDRLVQGGREGDEVYILPTYTAMNEIRKVLSKLTRAERAS